MKNREHALRYQCFIHKRLTHTDESSKSQNLGSMITEFRNGSEVKLIHRLFVDQMRVKWEYISRSFCISKDWHFQRKIQWNFWTSFWTKEFFSNFVGLVHLAFYSCFVWESVFGLNVEMFNFVMIRKLWISRKIN